MDRESPGPSAAPPGSAVAPVPPRSRALVAWLVASGTLAVLLTLAVASGGRAVTGLDRRLTELTRGWADALGWPVDVAAAIGRLTAPGWSTLAAALLTVVLLLARHRAAALFLAGSALFGVALTEGTKLVMGRQRPPGAGAFELDLDKSFPSGHSSAGIYLYLVTGLILLRLGQGREAAWLRAVGRVLIVVGPTIGISRLVLGVHWPTDVLGGWAFGSSVALACALLLWGPLHLGWAEPRVPPGPPAPPDG